MKHFAAVLQEGGAKKLLLVSYNSLKFVLRNFKVTDDFVPSYEGFLMTFNTLCSLSRTHKGEWPNDSTAENLMKIFRYYSYHFSYNHLMNCLQPCHLCFFCWCYLRKVTTMSNCFSTFLRIRPNWRLPLIFRNSLICTRNYNLSICARMRKIRRNVKDSPGKKIPGAQKIHWAKREVSSFSCMS